MSEPDNTLSTEAKTRIISHMNDDHADACLLYVQHYGEREDALAAKLIDIEPSQMLLQFSTAQGEEHIAIQFPAPLATAQEAHHTLVDMVISARGKTGD